MLTTNVVYYISTPRDLKPENIILTEDFHICITDFGSAKFMNHTKEIAGKYFGGLRRAFF